MGVTQKVKNYMLSNLPKKKLSKLDFANIVEHSYNLDHKSREAYYDLSKEDKLDYLITLKLANQLKWYTVNTSIYEPNAKLIEEMLNSVRVDKYEMYGFTNQMIENQIESLI